MYTQGRDPLARVKMDVTEKNGAYLVHAELPGVKKEDIQLCVDGAQVTLSAEIKREKDAKEGERVLHTERVYGKVSRSFTLPQEIDDAAAKAKFAAGPFFFAFP